MENVAEALKIAFSALMFVLALTLSISCFSQASTAIQAITTLRDREANYTYVQPTRDLSRTVGIETVLSTMYRAYAENIEIYFFKANGDPLGLYYATDSYGNVTNIEISSIDLRNDANKEYTETFMDMKTAKEHLDIIIGGRDTLNQKNDDIQDKYENRFIYDEGLYNAFKDARFQETFGEYEQGSGPSANDITKRVITYTLQP